MEMMRVPSSRGEWAMTTSRPASKPKVISRSSPYSKRSSSNVTQGPENTCAASSKLRPCLARFFRFLASSYSYFISECSSFCSYKQAFPLRGLRGVTAPTASLPANGAYVEAIIQRGANGRTPDILALGYLANLVHERLHGSKTYFNVNRHINPTDVCVASCRLCAFGKRVRDPRAYTMSLEEVWQRAGEGWSEAVTEFHIVGGLHPELTLDWFCEMLRGLKQRFPTVHLKAFTMVEIPYPGAAPRSSTSACGASSAITKSTATNGWRPRASPTSWACAPTAPCCTSTWRMKRTGQTTRGGCARS